MWIQIHKSDADLDPQALMSIRMHRPCGSGSVALQMQIRRLADADPSPCGCRSIALPSRIRRLADPDPLP